MVRFGVATLVTPFKVVQALARILGQVDIPDTTPTRSLHARKAAIARWQPQQGQEAS